MAPSSPNLSGRRVLVTAGPTWVRLDPVRHIGNVSTGATGLAIARDLARAGSAVTLLLGPGRAQPTASDHAQLSIVPFVTFDELHVLVRRHVGSGAYDAMVHTAAVSDYRPVSEDTAKISSDADELVIRLVRTPKIVDEVRGLDPDILLVKFKLEVARAREQLLQIASESRRRSDADLIVANDLSQIGHGRHPAVLLDSRGSVGEVGTTEQLAGLVAAELGRRLAGRPHRESPPPVERGSAEQRVV